MSVTISSTSINNLTVPSASGTLVGSGTNYPLNIDANAANESLKIDSSGALYNPNTPSFKAYSSGGQINSNNTLLVFNDTSYAGGHNVGGHYDTSNGRFTAPVAGYYLFMMSMLTNNSFSSNTWVRIFWRINGSNTHYHSHNHTGSWIMESGSAVFYLTANDYVDIYMTHGSGHYGTYSYFSGRLLG